MRILYFNLCVFFILPLNVVFGTRLVCYFDGGNARNARLSTDIDRLAIANVESQLCTHVIYSSVVINPKNIDTALNNQNFHQLAGLKAKNTKLKVMVQISEITVLEVLQDGENFAKAAVRFLQHYKLDGVDLPWTSPTLENTDKFHRLLRALKNAFTSENYILSVQVAADPTIIKNYDAKLLYDMADFINVASYDMNKAEKTADHPSPLRSSPLDREKNGNVDESIRYWLNDKRFAAEKINMGIPFHGIRWTLNERNVVPPLHFASNPTTMAYYEICNNTRMMGKMKRWEVDHDENHNLTGCVAYLLGEKESASWVGYDDISMVISKTTYACSNKLGGVMVWDLSQDDFANLCGNGKNPLLNAINETIVTTCPVSREVGTVSPRINIKSGANKSGAEIIMSFPLISVAFVSIIYNTIN